MRQLTSWADPAPGTLVGAACNKSRILRGHLGPSTSHVGPPSEPSLAERYFAIVKLSEAGAECWPAASAVMMSS
jgi:hypothetical protein